MSSVLDQLLQEENARQQRAAIDASISEYYDNLSAAEISESDAWGRFALEQFPES